MLTTKTMLILFALMGNGETLVKAVEVPSCHSREEALKMIAEVEKALSVAKGTSANVVAKCGHVVWPGDV